MLHLVLRAYCLGLIKTCGFVHHRISKEHYYEVSRLIHSKIDLAWSFKSSTNFTQEEDFVANLYSRDLLPKVDVVDICHMIHESLTYVNKLTSLSNSLKTALINRLELRSAFLSAVQFDEIIGGQRVASWERSLTLLPVLSETVHLGVQVEASFSVKVQRRLASTVPPRPIVNIHFNEAFDRLVRLCQDGKDSYRILHYHGATHLIVSTLYDTQRECSG